MKRGYFADMAEFKQHGGKVRYRIYNINVLISSDKLAILHLLYFAVSGKQLFYYIFFCFYSMSFGLVECVELKLVHAKSV